MGLQELLILIIFAAPVIFFLWGRRDRRKKPAKERPLTDFEKLNPGYIKGACFAVPDGKDIRDADLAFIAESMIDSGDHMPPDVKERVFNRLWIGDVHIPPEAETKGFLVVGRPGSGKTLLLSQIIEKIRLQGRKAIIHDSKADYLERFYNSSRDLVFNPLDVRCVQWDIFSRVEGPWDLENAAHAIIPVASSNTDQHWNDSARNVLIGAMTYLVQEGKANNSELVRLISDKVRLVEILVANNLLGAEHVMGFPDSKEAQSVISTFTRYTTCLRYLPNTANGITFDFDAWINSKEGGLIFVTNYQRTKDALTPLLSLFIESFIKSLLSQRDDLQRRVYLILDEFGQLRKIPSISSIITQGRSKGAATFLGIQDLAQIEHKYSKAIKQSIVNSLSNHVIMNVTDPETANFFSDECGEVQRWRKEYSEGEGYGDASGTAGSSNNYHYSSNVSEKVVTEKLILPSEILNMPELRCILRLVNDAIRVTDIRIKDYKKAAAAFLLDPRFSFASNAEKKAQESINNAGGVEDD